MSGKHALTEYESKRLLSDYGLKTTRDAIVHTAEEALEQADVLGYPVALKLSCQEFLHKTELGGVKLNLESETSLRDAVEDFKQRFEEPTPLLISEHVKSTRELIAGVTRNDEYGLTLAFGIGGIFAEVIGDVVFRLLPISEAEIKSMFEDLIYKEFLGPFRGEPETDLNALSDALMAVGKCALERDDVASIDVNPILISGGLPIAVDALVELYD